MGLRVVVELLLVLLFVVVVVVAVAVVVLASVVGVAAMVRWVLGVMMVVGSAVDRG
jgi:hypothetical protein